LLRAYEICGLASYLSSFDKLSPQLHVRGLADPRGVAAFNLALSRKRCNAVVDYLKKGVSPEVIKMEEKGATNVSMDDSAALRESRRVEFTLKAALAKSA
jgi:outer membrane protein OmpA-like peptidoglycan-associated protein